MRFVCAIREIRDVQTAELPVVLFNTYNCGTNTYNQIFLVFAKIIPILPFLEIDITNRMYIYFES